MNIVIVNGGRHIARQFYAGKYVAGESSAPDCWSNDGTAPDASVEEPQAKTCEGCPQNIKGSGQGETRACRFKRRVAVILPEEVGGNNHGDIYQLEVASKSIFGKLLPTLAFMLINIVKHKFFVNIYNFLNFNLRITIKSG